MWMTFYCLEMSHHYNTVAKHISILSVNILHSWNSSTPLCVLNSLKVEGELSSFDLSITDARLKELIKVWDCVAVFCLVNWIIILHCCCLHSYSTVWEIFLFTFIFKWTDVFWSLMTHNIKYSLISEYVCMSRTLVVWYWHCVSLKVVCLLFQLGISAHHNDNSTFFVTFCKQS